MENIEDIKYILNGFMFVVSGILVMWMTVGFCMLETGLTRAKNGSTVLTKNVGLFVISCTMFYLVGYNLMYGEGNTLFGYGFMLGGKSNEDFAHPLMADFFFQLMFVASASSVISGTIAERMKLWPFFAFVMVISGFIYPLVGHWTWGGSELGGLLSGFSDFAGSTIVHSLGGWAALAGVLVLGARKGKYGKNGQVRPIPGSNLPLATLGTFILWMGWFGFNGGSQLAMSSKADIESIALVVVNTNLAACSGAIAAMVLTYFIYKKIDLTFVLNGALAGLVACTAGPNLGSLVAIFEGIVGGALIVFAVPFFDKLKIDDPVGALSVHLVSGIWGTLAVGIFNPEVAFLTQLKGVVVIGAFVFVTSFVVWKVLDKFFGIRVEEETEVTGMDIQEIGLECYPEFKKV